MFSSGSFRRRGLGPWPTENRTPSVPGVFPVPVGMKISKNHVVQNRTSKDIQMGHSEKTRRRMARERRGAGSSLVSMETQY